MTTNFYGEFEMAESAPTNAGKYFIRDRDGRFLTKGIDASGTFVPGTVMHLRIGEFDPRERSIMYFDLREIPASVADFERSAMVALNDHGMDGDEILIA